MKKNDIIRIAEQFCKDYNVTNYPVNIVELCKTQGISVFEEYLPEDVSGFIVTQQENFKDYGANKVIVVNLLDIASRRRFTIAHELAHFFLHKSKDEDLFAHRDTGKNSGIEQEANIFASNILMPKYLVQDALSKIDPEISDHLFDSVKISYISKEFAVSKTAAEVRLKQLDII